MAAPSYTEDLSDLATGDEASGWVEMTGSVGGNAYSAMGSPAYQDADYPFIQGSYSVTQDCTKNTSVGSLCYDNTTGTGGHGTDGAYFVWQNFMVASNVGTYAQGGFQIVVGSGLGDFDVWYTGGVDKAPYPYGGWINSAVNTTVTPDGTAGTPTSTERYIGSAVYIITGPSKGETHNVDVIRYGRGSAIFEFGDLTNGYATIPGFATQNDNSTNRWGLIQETSGGYLWKGRMQLGTATNAVDFRDSDRIIFVQWTPKVTANFNLIEVINASSNIEMTNFQFIVLDTTTASSGRFLMTNDANVALDSCSFSDMDTFVFSKSTNTVTIIDSSFKRCGIITQGGATFTGCSISGHSGTHAMLATNPSVVTTTGFVSGGSGHAMRCDTIGTYDWNITDSGYTGTRGTNLVSSSGSADAMFYNNSGGLITLNVTGSGLQPSVRNGAGATTQVNASVDVVVTVKDKSGTELSGIPVYIVETGDQDNEIMDATTNVSGVASTTYSGATPLNVDVHVRSGSGGTNYIEVDSPQVIAAGTGLTTTITLSVDPNNAT